MSKHHVTAVFEQFPWLNQHFGTMKKYLDEAEVSRVDKDTLELRADRTYSVAYEAVIPRKIFIFDEDGALICRVHRMRWYDPVLGANPLFVFESAGRSVEEAMDGLGGKVRNCSYIVSLRLSKIVILRKPKECSIYELLKTSKRATMPR